MANLVLGHSNEGLETKCQLYPPKADIELLYHRKDGKVVKEGDHLMAATRYAS
jgi:hypothetical protein